MGAHWLATRDGAVSPGQPVAKHEAQDRDREKKINFPFSSERAGGARDLAASRVAKIQKKIYI